MQQYGQKPYCVLLFKILYNIIAIFGIILPKRGGVYSVQRNVRNEPSIGDLRGKILELRWIVLEILAKIQVVNAMKN